MATLAPPGRARPLQAFLCVLSERLSKAYITNPWAPAKCITGPHRVTIDEARRLQAGRGGGQVAPGVHAQLRAAERSKFDVSSRLLSNSNSKIGHYQSMKLLLFVT